MKKILLLIFCIPFIGVAQQTYVPDDNFEQELINLGYDNVLDDYVNTSSIDTITLLNIGSNGNIIDLTGIEEFTLLEYLNCGGNQIVSLDVSSNLRLKQLYCDFNQIQTLLINDSLEALDCNNNLLSNLNLNNGKSLYIVDCSFNLITSISLDSCSSLNLFSCKENQLDSLDISNTDIYSLDCSNNLLIDLILNDSIVGVNSEENLLQNVDLSNLDKLGVARFSSNQLTTVNTQGAISLGYLDVSNNQFIDLDISILSNLQTLLCWSNQLASLDLKNGNNINMSIDVTSNPNLDCISVDDTSWAITNWTVSNNNIDPQHFFSTNCNTTNIEEFQTEIKTLKIVDVLGRETIPINNTPLFYIYDDGKVEKKIIIE